MLPFLLALVLCFVAQAGTIQGTVIDSVSRQPVRKAAVTLTSMAPDRSYAIAVTDAAGRFTLPAIPQGRFRLTAAHNGFFSIAYGSTSPQRMGAELNLVEGETRAGITLLLAPANLVSGTVTDPQGDGIPGIQIAFYRKRLDRGKPRFFHTSTSITDTRGHYEVAGVLPGEYSVSAQPGFAQAVRARPIAVVGEKLPPESFAPQVYPSAVPIVAGRDTTGIDFHLNYAPQVALHGTVTGIPEDVKNAIVMVEAESIAGSGDVVARMPLSSEKPAFQLAGIVSGSYRVVVQAGSRRAVTAVQLTAPDTELNIALAPGVPLAGSIEVEGPGADKVSNLRIALSPGDGIPNGGLYTTSEENAFEFEEVPAGIWDIGITNLPRGAYIKSMRLSKQDVLLEDMVIRPDSKGPLAIVVSTAAPKIEGTVEPAGPAFILAAPTGGLASVFSFYQTAQADEKGHFTMTGLHPGIYRLYAFHDVEQEAWQDPKFLPPFESQSKLLKLKEGVTETLTLPVQ